MSKYDIFAISMSNLVGLGPIFHSLWHMFPVRLILSEVLVIGRIRFMLGRARMTVLLVFSPPLPPPPVTLLLFVLYMAR